MILLYHKVDLVSPTKWWVHVDAFYRQMCELRAKNVVYLDDYDAADPHQVVITFDGVYQDVHRYALPILERFGYPFELFVTSDYIGRGNEFDGPEPDAAFADFDELAELVAGGGRIQWHGRAHIDVRDADSFERVQLELTPTEEVLALDPKGCRWVAYPYGHFDDRALAAARDRFVGGLSVIQGNDHDVYVINREVVVNDSSFAKAKTAVVIASHDYGRFLVEAIESVLRQTRPFDEILVSDDGSSDDTAQIGRAYADRYPDRVRFHRNETALGIVDHFNQAVRSTTAPYVCILGADNRFRSDYVERATALLDPDPTLGVAYTDFSYFGPRAPIEHDKIQESWRGEIKADTHYIVRFPDFGPGCAVLLARHNFIHGSSLYRREAFEQVGGYRREANRPEDWSLFRRMVEAGWGARRVPEPVLEYRQHSRQQQNLQAQREATLQFFRRRCQELEKDLAEARSVIDRYQARATSGGG